MSRKPNAMNSKKNQHYLREELLTVKESPVHGKGLFAAKVIAKGTELGRCKTRKAKKDGPYVLWLEDEDRGVEVCCDLKYINHGSSPNVAYYDDLTVVALKRIPEGKELLHHYGDDWD